MEPRGRDSDRGEMFPVPDTETERQIWLGQSDLRRDRLERTKGDRRREPRLDGRFGAQMQGSLDYTRLSCSGRDSSPTPLGLSLPPLKLGLQRRFGARPPLIKDLYLT